MSDHAPSPSTTDGPADPFGSAEAAPLLPRYGAGSMAEVFPALLAALGVPGPPPAITLPPVRAVALLLVDGLGSDLLRAHAADAPFLASLTDHGPLTVGFPSSTSISLTSLGTGLPPGRHGIVGISFLACGERMLDSLGWTTYDAAEREDLRVTCPPEQLQPHPTAMERAAAAGVAVRLVGPREFRGSGLTRAALRGGFYEGVGALGDLAAAMRTAVARPGRPRLCYGYHADLDSIGHHHGPGSLPWRLQLRQVDLLASSIAEDLPPGSLLVVTGDHGMITVTRRYDADRLRPLRLGVRALGGDPRARHVYARPGADEDVLAAWRWTLGDDAWVVSREKAIAEGWFGPTVSDAVRSRIGDVVVAMRGTAAVSRSAVEPVFSALPGHHGSLTPGELNVPLLAFHR